VKKRLQHAGSPSFRYFLVFVLPAFIFCTISFTPPLSAGQPNSAAAKLQRPLTISYGEFMPFYFSGLNNQPRGILVDIWQLWSQKTGIDVDFVLSPRDVSNSDLILNKADINGLMVKTREQEKSFDFTLPLFDLATFIYFRSDLSFGPEKLSDLQALTIGVVSKDFSASYLRQHLDGTTPLFFPDHEKLVQSALNGTIQAFLMEGPVASTYLAKHDASNLIHRLANPVYKKPIYAGLKIGNQELLNKINDGLLKIGSHEIDRVIQNWTGNHNELVWQPFTGHVKIVASIDNMPFHFADKKGQAIGMFIDLWQLWSTKTGIPIEFLTAPWAKSLEMVKTGQADIHAGCFFSVKRDTFLDYAGVLKNTQTHFFFHESIFGLKNLQDLIGFKIGVLDQDYAVEFVNRELPDAALKKYDSHRELFKGVSNGEVKVFICDTPTALYFLKEEDLLKNFRYHAARPLYRKPFYAAVQQGNTTLLRQVNKGLAAITPEEKAAIERKWMGPSPEKAKDTLMVAALQDFPPFSFIGAKGKPSGLFVDLWQLWSQKTGRPVTFKLYNRIDAIHALKDGIVDVLSTLPPKNQVAGWGDIAVPYYRFDWYLYESQGASLFNPPTLRPGQVLGVVSGTRAWEWASTRQPGVKLAEYDSAKDMILAAASGTIPAFLALPQEMAVLPGQLGVGSDFKISTTPVIQHPVGAFVQTLNPELMHRISQGFNRLSNDQLVRIENRWITQPDARFFSPTSDMIRFTPDERKWLTQHRRPGTTINLGIRPDLPPFEFIDNDDIFLGMVSDYVDLLNQRLGINMTVGNTLKQSAITEYKASGSQHIDVLPSAASLEAPSPLLKYTSPYLSFPWVIVNKHQSPLIGGLRDLHQKTVAVIKWYDIRRQIQADHPAITILPVASVKKGLSAVRNGKADAYVENLAIVGYQLKEHNDTELKVAAATEYDDAALSFAVRSDWPQLVTILNKGLSTISAREHDRIRQKWFSIRFEHGVDEKLLRTLVIRGTVIGSIILVIILFWHFQIKRREERFRCLTEHGTDIIQAFSPDGTIIYQSPSFTSILGYKPQSLIGSRVFNLLHPSDKAPWEKMIQKLVMGKEDKSVIHRLLHTDGHYLFFESILSNLTDNKALNAIVMNGRDITERLNAEYEMQQAREMAEAANITKTDFLASLSHEIRTPLNAILGMTDVTLGTPLDSQQEKNLTTVKYSARHLLDVISDILDFSTIEAGKMRIQKNVFSLKDLLANIELTWGFQAREKGLDFSLNKAEDIPEYLSSDPVRLRQIIGNLLSNAIKFTHDGHITLTIRREKTDTPGQFSLLFCVQDSGIGIDADRLDSIFERFTQAQASITREYGGTGLGLAICREITRLMGGTLDVKSRPGKGSRFFLYLPFDIDSLPKKMPDTPVGDPDFLDSPPSHSQPIPLTLLLVEDDQMNARVFNAFLAPSRHKVYHAPDGLNAISLLKQHSIDIVFMDIEMPRLDGLTTCRKIRNGEAGTANLKVPVIAMTAHVLDEFKEKSIAVGMNDFLAKPVEMSQLFKIIEKHRPSPKHPSQFDKLDINKKKALASLGGDQKLFDTVCRIFIEQTPEQLAQLEAAVTQKQLETIRITAHTLKGAAGRIFADQCRDNAAMLEESAMQGDEKTIEKQARTLIIEFNALINGLKKAMPQGD